MVFRNAVTTRHLRAQDQVLVAHELRHRRRDLGRDRRSEPRQFRSRRLPQQEMLPQLARGHVRDRLEGALVVRVENEPRDVVGLVGHHRLGEDLLQ